MLSGEYRHLHTQRLHASSPAPAPTRPRTRATATAKNRKDFRGYFHGIGGYGVSDHSNAGYDVYLSSDNTFLDRYQFDDADVLRSRAYLEGQEDRNFWTLNGYYFQGLRPLYDQDTIPVALPFAETRLVSDRMRWGSYFTADSNVLALTRNQGPGHARGSRTGSAGPCPMSGRSAMSDGSTSACAATSTTRKATRAPSSPRGGNNSEARVLPRFTADWSWPLADADRRLGPRDRARWSASTSRRPGATRATSPTRTARTSSSTRPTCSSPVRFPGLDRVDTGTKVAYGLRFSSLGPRATEFSGTLRPELLVHRRTRSSRPDSGVQDHLSDYVGAFYVRPSALLDLSYRFRLGKDDLKFRRSDALAAFGPGFLRFNLGYINLSQEPRGVRRRQQQLSEPDRLRLARGDHGRRARSS